LKGGAGRPENREELFAISKGGRDKQYSFVIEKRREICPVFAET